MLADASGFFLPEAAAIVPPSGDSNAKLTAARRVRIHVARLQRLLLSTRTRRCAHRRLAQRSWFSSAPPPSAGVNICAGSGRRRPGEGLYFGAICSLGRRSRPFTKP